MQYIQEIVYDAAETGRRIRLARKQRGMTQGELAARLGFRAARPVHAMEQGGYNLSVTKFIQLCNILKLPPEYLLFGEGPGPNAAADRNPR